MVGGQSLNNTLASDHCSLTTVSLVRANHEMNLVDCTDFVAIDHGYIAMCKMLQFGTPSRVGDFYSQHATREFQRPRPFCHRRSAG